jgi:O-antigen/teichoic acid export membrane protein
MLPLQQYKINYIKIVEWGKLIVITGSAQVAVQAISLISSILIIRLLPTQEYALYTLANTMLGAMTVLADGGISTGVMSQGGKVWQDREKLGAVLATGLDLRKKFAVGSLLIAAPILLFLLHKHDASWLMSVLIIISIIPAFLTTISSTLLEIVPKLLQEIKALQKIQVLVNIGRLLLACLTIFVFPYSFLAILAAGIPQIWANKRIANLVAVYTDHKQNPDKNVRTEILIIVKKVLPGAIYYCFSGQITIWLISIYSSTNALAQAGALGRLAILFNIITVVFSTLIVPRFSRINDDFRKLLNSYLLINLLIISLLIVLVILVWLFSDQILWVLGPRYINLKNELFLITAGSALNFISSCAFMLCAARGWVLQPFISLPIITLIIITSIMLVDVSTLDGVLLLTIFTATGQILLNNIYSFFKISSVRLKAI